MGMKLGCKFNDKLGITRFDSVSPGWQGWFRKVFSHLVNSHTCSSMGTDEQMKMVYPCTDSNLAE